MKIKILCIVDYYLPGFKGGGVIRTIENMVAQMGHEFDFFVITRDRDLGSKEPYGGVKVNEWVEVGLAKVFYASPGVFGFLGILRLMREVPHDLIYLNSYFSRPATLFPLLARFLGLYKSRPVILAPRGELSNGALKVKSLRKAVFVCVANIVGLYRDVIWQVSSSYEANDLRNTLKNVRSDRVCVAPDTVTANFGFPFIEGGCENESISKGVHEGRDNRIRIIFLSRIVEIKNLLFLLHVLGKVHSLVDISIYGPIQDFAYWQKCEAAIRNLPRNVKLRYRGVLAPNDVRRAFEEHDVFFFPTQGENFGHVIFEALASGTCVVVSDRTPWQEDPNGGVEVIPLENPEGWTSALERWAGYPRDMVTLRRRAALDYGKAYVGDSAVLRKNIDLFVRAYRGVKA